MLSCQGGRAANVLTPPPVLPPLSARRPSPSFHTMSGCVPPLCGIVVPPTASTYGLPLGKSTYACPSCTPSPEPSSPAATQLVRPMCAASRSVSLTCLSNCLVHTCGL